MSTAGGAMASTGSGSFRGVPFLVYREQRERGGRNVSRREYPLRETGGSDDLGPKLQDLTFTAIVSGTDAQQQRARLRDALRAPGAGEMTHPDYGTLNVLITDFESRYNVSEQYVVEFTISATPASDDTAPTVQTDTADVLTARADTAMNSLFNTLADGWSVASDRLHDIQAMADTVSEKIGALQHAVMSIGIMQDVSTLGGSLAALRGSIASLVTMPSRMAQEMAGVFTYLAAAPSLPLLRKNPPRSSAVNAAEQAPAGQSETQLYHALSALHGALVIQDERRALTGLTPQTQKKILLIQCVMQSAVVLLQAQVAGSLLTLAINTSHRTANQNAPSASLLESATDVRAVSDALGSLLDNHALAFSALGYTATALALRQTRLALVEDLITRGVRLPGVTSVVVRTTEPALVTLYRATGDSAQWHRFVRRNAIVNPVFVPGGYSMEVIDESS